MSCSQCACQVIVFIGALCMATNGATAKGQPELSKEEKLLAGLWRIDVMEGDGHRITAKEYKDQSWSSDIFESRWLFTATKAEWVVSSDDKFEYAKFKLDVGAKPKAIDMQIYDTTLRGIYELNEKGLKACFSVRNPEGKKLEPGKEKRPTDFKTKEASERLLLIFVRDEKAKN